MIIKKKISLMQIAKVFLTFGAIGFGGGFAILSLMMETCVKRKRWLASDEFSYGLAFGQFLGARTVNAAIFIGYRARGFIGAIVAAVSFLAPSVTLIIILASLYMHFREVPSLEEELKGVRPVFDALILSAAFNMGKGRINNFESVFLIIATIFFVLVLKVQVFILMLAAVFYGVIKIKFFGGKENENV